MADHIDLDGVKHLLKQAALGEWAVLDDVARTMSADEFAKAFGKPIRFWGKNDFYRCVVVEGTEYLWKTDSGIYDGWNSAPRCDCCKTST